MKLPVLHGTIRRRILANWRVHAETAQALLPSPLKPKLQAGKAIAGVCLIRLEDIRPELVKALPLGIDSENAAHRIAVEWTDEGVRKEGVFIWRRDSSSFLNQLAGGRLFPGVHGAATFDVEDDRTRISFEMKGADVAISLRAEATQAWPTSSVFQSVDEASRFFETGSAGYSVTDDPTRLDGMHLVTDGWKVDPLDVKAVRSSFFDDLARFPAGTATFDHAIVMRDLTHHWQSLPDLTVGVRSPA
ncbi:MAG: DUF2071 domain-containing protein [Myxococcus sp.]|nr:DUF2071 domain-containing protein [Myxococcus sp.]